MTTPAIPPTPLDTTGDPLCLDSELDALRVIIGGFESLPVEALDRVYSFLMSRFPAALTVRAKISELDASNADGLLRIGARVRPVRRRAQRGAIPVRGRDHHLCEGFQMTDQKLNLDELEGKRRDAYGSLSEMQNSSACSGYDYHLCAIERFLDSTDQLLAELREARVAADNAAADRDMYKEHLRVADLAIRRMGGK